MSALARALPVFLALPLLAAPSPARAATEISCHASGDAHFLPGVQSSPQAQHVTYAGTLQECVDHSALGITGVRFSAVFTDLRLGCADSDFAGTGTGTVNGTVTLQWRLGRAKPTSTADVTLGQAALNRVTMSGVVRDGAFPGRQFTGAFDANLLGALGRCESGNLFGPVRSAPFQGDFTLG